MTEDERIEPAVDQWIEKPRDEMRRNFMAGGVASGFALAVQPVSAQTVITTDTNGLTAGMVEVTTSEGKMPGYRARPAASAAAPVIVVVQEIFGVHEHIKDVCRRLAKLGYYAIAPELYFRAGDPSKAPDIPAIAAQILPKVTDKQVLSDVDSTVAFAKAEGAQTDKLGITGFCWGGRIVWLYAAHNPSLKAGVAWYGRVTAPASEQTPKHPLDIVADIKAPVLGLYAGADAGIPVDGVKSMEAALKAAGKKSEIIIYPDMPHGFHADYRPSYRETQAKDGWERLKAWFKANGV